MKGNEAIGEAAIRTAFFARSGIVPINTLKYCVRKEFRKKPKIIPLNMEAVKMGAQYSDKKGMI